MQPSSRETEPPAAGPGEPPGSEPAPTPVAPVERRRGWLARMFRSHVRPVFSRRLSRLAAAVVPSIYLGYMRLVWATSRIDTHNFQDLHGIIERYNGAVGLLWHEEVMTVAYGYYYLGFRPHTLASVGDSGELIARMLDRCGFVVFRGGSTTGRARRREGTLQAMIDHMRNTDRVIYGLTVDGSKGPRYHIKRGGVVIARECGRPVILARTWFKRYLRLPTWDQMALPLPFNQINYYLLGPYEVPESAKTDEGLERFRLQLENDLIGLAARSYDDVGKPRPTELVSRAGVPESKELEQR